MPPSRLKQKSKPDKQSDDLEILENIRNKIYDDLTGVKPKMKVGDLVKVIALKNKLTVTGKSEKKFWGFVNGVRQEKLDGKTTEEIETVTDDENKKKA